MSEPEGLRTEMEPDQRGIGLTPVKVLEWAEKEAGLRFTIDGCASPEHARMERFISPDEDFIKTQRDFTGETVWLNPPYVARRANRYSTADFVKRAATIRDRFDCPIAVLLENNMAGTGYFGEHVGHTPAQRLARCTEIFFYPGRINFENFEGTNKRSSIMVVFRPRGSSA